jgi:hypothetical protein
VTADLTVSASFAAATNPPVFTISVPAAPQKTVTPGLVTAEPSYTVTATLDGAVFHWGDSVSGTGSQGSHTIEVSVQTAGGVTVHSAVFVIDATAPSTQISPALPAGTILTPVTIQLSAVDLPAGAGASSGVAAIFYKLDSAATFTGYSGGVPVSAWGDHTIVYYAIDNAGNIEAAHTVKFSMRRPTTLSITTSTKAPTHGHSFTLSGYLTPGVSGERILFKYQRPGSSKWYSVTVRTTTSGLNGKWSYRYTPSKKGTYHFKAWYDTTTTKYRSGSSTLTLKAK